MPVDFGGKPLTADYEAKLREVMGEMDAHGAAPPRLADAHFEQAFLDEGYEERY